MIYSLDEKMVGGMVRFPDTICRLQRMYNPLIPEGKWQPENIKAGV